MKLSSCNGDSLGVYRDNGKENGNYYSILRFKRDIGNEKGSYHRIMEYVGLWLGRIKGLRVKGFRV